MSWYGDWSGDWLGAWLGDPTNPDANVVVESVSAGDEQSATVLRASTIVESVSAGDEQSANVVRPVTGGGGGGGAAGGWYPTGPTRTRVVRPRGPTTSRPSSSPVGLVPDLVDIGAPVDQAAHQRLQEQFRNLQERYARHTQYLRQTVQKQEKALADAEARAARRGGTGSTQAILIAKLQADIGALKQQLAAAEVKEAASKLMRRIRNPGRSVAQMLANVANPSPNSELSLVIPEMGYLASYEPPRILPLWWIAAGIGAVGMLLPIKQNKHKKSLYIVAGALALVGAVRWIRARK